MLKFALEYRKAIDVLTLSKMEWIITQQLCNILSVLKDVTQFFSHGTPNLATVIPAMDYINDHLIAHSKNCALSPTIKASLGLGKRTLNCYYSLTDSSEVYLIAMVLHPRHKLKYFEKANWEQDWIDTAWELVHEEFERSYKQDSGSENEESPSPSPKEVCGLSLLFYS
ncbi:hypothetical protein L208DRAFT_1423064 [Tricholoma matsutake]|nr:hypothetical protein L208DRAFT_1423064 [Tricholoma matsutake 945]